MSVLNPSLPRWKGASLFAPAGACIYLAGFALPLEWDIPLVVLALSGVLTSFSSLRVNPAGDSSLLFPALLFLWATGLSVLASEDIGRSLRLSAPLAPALLIFFLITDYFRGPKHVRLLYLTFSVVALGLALAVLRTVWKIGWTIPPGWQNWIADVQSPLLNVANDTAFLGVLAPLSLALIWCENGKVVKVLSGLSILVSICAVSLTQSRVAILTMIVSITCVTAFIRPRLALAFGCVVLGATLLIDGFLGFPLATKFVLIWSAESGQAIDARLPIWSTAWSGFLSSPLWGHGPHTFHYTSFDSISLSWPHNLYLETLAERGIIGFSALGFLLVRGLSAAWRTQRAQLSETRILGAGALSALFGFCFAAFIELSFLRLWVVVVFFTLLGAISHAASCTANRRTTYDSSESVA